MKVLAFSLVCLASVLAHAFPTSARIAEIQTLANRIPAARLLDGIEIRANDRIPGPAWTHDRAANGRYLLEYNPKLLSRFAPSVTRLIFYHEFGHVYLSHHLALKTTPQFAAEYELEADVFAATMFARFERDYSGLGEFFAFMETQSHTRPSGPERLKIFRSVLRIDR